MTEFLLLLSLWPFHHKKPAEKWVDCGGVGYLPCEVVDAGCDKVGNLYFYTGDDKMIGISGASCEAAKKDYESAHIDPVRMSKA